VKSLTVIAIFSALIIFSGCNNKTEISTGKLFIIGGGEKRDSMMNELVSLSGIRNSGYMYILPMASSVPDSSVIWAREDFNGTGITFMPGFAFEKDVPPPKEKVDSLRLAKLIFICGGDQSRFMDVVRNTPVMDAIKYAYRYGAVIAGTSAGAAVMSRTMITGNQKKHTDPDAGFTTIESDNIETVDGLGLLQDVIIDQHFIKRQRLNRLVAVSIEHPDQLCIGIDESTAIVVEGDMARVTGVGQAVVIKNKLPEKTVKNGLLGTKGLELSVYLPGDKFRIR
jgi:cyanophycinase